MRIDLLPSRPYSASDPATLHCLGLALERQAGVHAIGTDHRRDFDTWPGTLVWTPPGIDVFSESPKGGEYLVLRWDGDETPTPSHRVEWRGDRRAMAVGVALRREMLGGTDPLRLRELALRLRSLIEGPPRAGGSRRRYAALLDLIEEDPGRPLPLEEMAAMCGQTELAFLRGFSAAIGQTPHAYLTARRVAASRRLLSETRLPLAMVAADCGFSQQSHFGTAFRGVTGMTPGAYRRKMSNF